MLLKFTNYHDARLALPAYIFPVKITAQALGQELETKAPDLIHGLLLIEFIFRSAGSDLVIISIEEEKR